jgi:hypothetical protein
MTTRSAKNGTMKQTVFLDCQRRALMRTRDDTLKMSIDK